MRLGILPEHGFKHKGNHYASLPWFGTKIAQKYAIKGSKFSGFRRDVKPHVLTFSTSGQRQVTTFCTCTVSSRKKCHVSGCRRQAGDVCCLTNRDLTQQDGWKTQDGRMTKKCCARLCIPGLARHFYTSFCRPESSSRPVA